MSASGRAEQERIDPVTFGEWHYEPQSSGLRDELTCEMTCVDMIAIAQRREGVLDQVDHSFWGKLVWMLNRPRASQGRDRIGGAPAESCRAGSPWRQYSQGEVAVAAFDR
jgi:hypothetical protein